YRRLAAILHHGQHDTGLRVVMVTSAISGEGKSLTTTNLALTLTRSYERRVLLIDADLRRPTLHLIFQLENVRGVNEFVQSRGTKPLHLVPVAPRLFLLPAGRPDSDPLGALTSETMRRIVAEARDQFDWVLIDTPPIGLLPDAGLLGGIVDGALLVVRAGHSPYDLIKRAVESVGRERILGVVFNGADTSRRYGNDYYGYYGKSNYGKSR
ncbi:MAG: CpsD/CapB family tyrosine-protein kinase, partial [Acidobacteria bacterium]|nr:CpsD/CapB family tyrosine-protein kinase [Acidobacteriota bacterium]